jgi:hypothetical protein
MTTEDVDAEELFQRIQRNLLQVEEEDDDDDGLETTGPSEITINTLSETKEPGNAIESQKNVIQEGPTESGTLDIDRDTVQEVAGVQEQPKKKVYQFTEVSGGAKKDVRRFSQSKQFTGLQTVPTHNPLLRSQDVSMYRPSTDKLDQLLKSIQKRNQQMLEVLSSNQVRLFHKKNIFKRFLMVNMLSEEIMKKSDEHLQMSTSRTAEDKMREFEIVEVSILKYKTHLTYMTQR